MSFVDEGDAEGLLHGGDGAGELDGAALGAWGVGGDGEAELFGEGADQLYGGGVGAMIFSVFGVGEALLAEAVGGLERGFCGGRRPRRLILVPRGCGLFAGGLNKGSFLAAGKGQCEGRRRCVEWISFSSPWSGPLNLGMNLYEGPVS